MSLDWLRYDDSTLYWLNTDRALVRHQPGAEPVELTPPGFRVGGGVHAYGGGDFTVTQGTVWCASADGLYRLNSDNTAVLVAPGAFGDLCPGDGELLAVREDEHGDALVAIPLDGGDVRVLAEAAGFFGSPRFVAGMLAWTWWSARDMPWDGCEVWVAAYEDGQIGDPMRVAGGPDESAIEPRWGPDGMLYFMSDRTGFRNLYRHDGTAIAPTAEHCAAVPWQLGHASYCFLDDGRIVLTTRDGLLLAGSSHTVPLPYASVRPCLAASGSSVALIGSSQVAVVRFDQDPPLVEVVAGAAEVLPVALDGGLAVHPPAGAPDDWSAPVIVCVEPLVGAVRYFTSRGFAVASGPDPLDVAGCVAVAEQLIAAGRAVPGQVFVRGTGLGGYTALRAVSQPGPFAAATAVSPVIDPPGWSSTAPRFLRPYAARLPGPVTAAAIDTPVLLIHDTDDTDVPAADVVELAAALRARNAPHELLLLEGTGPDTALTAELRLYQQLLDSN
ncbi:S9 family peptidase [Dactylosporangium siamense]|uniref:Peptidase n=1 Tax=Dactylosporangium siamense TaxID=685454 RepID=A0A919PL52_9ACTN|nr:prolyl oligopeptidase family serine peptidase [Dactylosporangium siamense]GIG46815.1 peptidase [Dactylosporangium siamense]